MEAIKNTSLLWKLFAKIFKSNQEEKREKAVKELEKKILQLKSNSNKEMKELSLAEIQYKEIELYNELLKYTSREYIEEFKLFLSRSKS